MTHGFERGLDASGAPKGGAAKDGFACTRGRRQMRNDSPVAS